SGLEGPYVSIGDCLQPYLSDGGLIWLDRELIARPGDLVMVDLDGALRTKELEQLPDGSAWLVSNVMAIPLLPRWRILGVIVAEWPRPPSWQHPFPELSAALNAQNAGVKRALAEKFELARRLKRQGQTPAAVQAAILAAAHAGAAAARRA